MAKPLREEMPLVAAFIDEVREAFGAPQINASIKAGIDGQPTFYASEKGREIGTESPPGGAVFFGDTLYLASRDSGEEKK